jgi:hypothetical protein
LRGHVCAGILRLGACSAGLVAKLSSRLRLVFGLKAVLGWRSSVGRASDL